eukprot:6207454-Pleurochrysis_carterae.AAC.5
MPGLGWRARPSPLSGTSAPEQEYLSRRLRPLRANGVLLACGDLVVLHKLRCRLSFVDLVLGERCGQVVLCFGLDVGRGGDLDSTVVARVDVHAQKLLRLVLHCQLETLAKDAKVIVCLRAACVGHPAVVDVEYQVDAMAATTFLEASSTGRTRTV